MERTVTVWGKPQVVKLSQSSRASWLAMGEYKGERLLSRGSSASSALAAWAANAKSRGKG